MRALKQSGFTLVELSLVLAVLGLLIGTVLGAQAMLNNQQLRQVSADANKYMIAINQFKQKYAYLPGDFPTATAIWGRADGGTPVTDNCASPNNTASVGKATCNGNGDGILDYSVLVGHEIFRAWHHLSNEGMISGNFTGRRFGAGRQKARLNINVPGSSIEQAGFSNCPWCISMSATYYVAENGTDPYHFDGSYANSITFGAETIGADWGTLNPALSGQEAFQIDRKTDDGQPAVGNIRSSKQGNAYTPNCTTNTTSSAEYSVANADKICALIFMNTLNAN